MKLNDALIEFYPLRSSSERKAVAPLDRGDATRARETVEQVVSEANRLGARLVFLP